MEQDGDDIGLLEEPTADEMEWETTASLGPGHSWPYAPLTPSPYHPPGPGVPPRRQQAHPIVVICHVNAWIYTVGT
jgi:hypothetical protein